MEDDEYATTKMGGIKLEDGGVNGRHADDRDTPVGVKSEFLGDHAQSPALSQDGLKSRSESVGTGTPTSQKPPKLSRKSSQQSQRQPFLYGDLPDVTEESCNSFQVIPDCLYGSKHLGATDNDALDCDCNQEWQNGENVACGEDSDCINRATKMECSSTGNCGGGCQNQRFQRREYAQVSVIKTEKKGYGLRADSDLHTNDFIFEYIGEVINEPTFRRRMIQYDEQGIKHFYFMSLSKSEFVDATKKGNLGRFCNHSCNPNCYVDKWVVGDKLRMGIFALRRIRPGEELVFNYNVDRYGAKPQPCYCGEHNCIGFIGGKTQTERATKLPAATVEALGIDGGDGWDTSIAKKPRKKRADEDDEEYVNSIQPRSLDEDDARKVMATLMQCKEKWIAVKLLERIQRCDDDRVVHVVMRMHAYQILKTVLNSFYEDYNVVLQVLTILDKFPRLTRNKIADSKIEASIEPLTKSEHEEVASTSQKLLSDWSKLEIGYRIRRRQGDANTPTVNAFDDRRGAAAREEESQKNASPQPIDAPKGPKSNQPQRGHSGYFNGRPARPRQFQGSTLPAGWFEARDGSNRTYFYDNHGTTTWIRPSKPAVEPAVNKAAQEHLAIQNIIKQVTKEGSTPKPAASRTPQYGGEPTGTPSKEEKWRSLPIEKQMKIYENTIFPPVKHMLDKFKHKLPKDELKRLGKDISKKLVASDYKNKRVTNPTGPLEDRQAKKIKNYVKEFLDKAVIKYNALHGTKDQEDKATPKEGSDRTDGPSTTPMASPPPMGEDSGVMMSDAENGQTPSDGERKRKREDDGTDSADVTPGNIPNGRDSKRLREEDDQPEPPPPPPPPAGENPDGIPNEQQKALRAQEEALIRENEEAERLEEQANKTEDMEHKADEMQRDIDAAQRNLNKANQEVMGH